MATERTPTDDPAAEAEHLRLAQEAGEIGTWEWDLASGQARWSRQMFRNLGLPDGCDGDLFAVLRAAIHPDDRALLDTSWEEFRQRPGPMRLELRTLRPDRAVRWVVFLGDVIADEAGQALRMLGITIDSTRRRNAEEAAAAALRDSERRLRELNERLEQLAEERARQLDASRAQIQAIFDNSPDWLTLFRATADGRFIYEDLNRATERAYGRSREQVIGRALEAVLGAEQAQLPLELMRACIATGENQRYTAIRSLAGETRTIDVMFVRVPEKYGGDYFIMATARDITEREAVEQQLRQAQKMEAVGHLTGGIAHDFNNLLTAVIGNLELLEPRVAGDVLAGKFIEGAQRAAQNGARLTEQLLAFSRRQHLQPRAVDLNQVVGNMRDLLARTIGVTVEVRSELAPDLWPAQVDPTQIEIAILNLAINARDAMPSGGVLIVATRNCRLGIDEVPSEIADGDCVCLSVEDSGIGMSEEVLRSAVEPFFTTKEVGKGSGLGLSQVYGMVQQSDGCMRIDSRLDFGTRVELYLPRAAAPRSVAKRPAVAAAEESGGRILVVDDDPAVRDITVQMLRQTGHVVGEAPSGQAALDALACEEAYDLLLVDLAMPEMSGPETVRRARNMRPGLPVLYMTGYAEPGGAEPQIGDDPLIKKPFRLSDIVEAVGNALRSPGPVFASPSLLRGRSF